MIIWDFLFMIISYFMGSVNNAIIICKALGLDIRQLGSGNPGTMNMIRSLGLHWGLLTLALDALKGVVPALLGWYFLGEQSYQFGDDKFGLYLCSAAVLIGHMFPIFYQFKGGKGVASTLGICFVLNWKVALIAFAVLVLIILITKIGFIASFVGVGIPLIYQSVIEFSQTNVINGLILIAMYGAVVFMHRANIVRFVHGKENKIILFGKNKSAKQNREKVATQKENRRQLKAFRLQQKNSSDKNDQAK